jgi:CrcB protein
MTILAISIGAILGANARYFLGRFVAERMGVAFPYGTLIINVSGSFLIGLLLAIVTERVVGPAWIRPALAIGFLGSYTTFSTFSYETLRLVENGSMMAAGVNVAVSVAASLIAVYLGTLLGRAL